MPPFAKELRRESMSATESMAFIPTDRALPRTIDDAERDFGLDIYDRMRNSPYIEGPLRYLEALVLEDGVPLSNPIPEPSPTSTPEIVALYDQGQEIVEFCQECLEELDDPFESTVESLLQAFSHGYEIAETTYRDEKGGKYGGKLMLESIRVIPRANYVMVATPYNRLLGALAIKPGKSAALYAGPIFQPETHPGFVTKEKLVHVTFRRPKGQLTGWSLIRSAYDAWKRVQIVKPFAVSRLAQCGGESLVVSGKPIAEDVGPRKRTMSDGTEQVVDFATWAADVVANAYQSGGVAVLLGDMKVLTAGGEHEAGGFEKFVGEANREMMVAVLCSARALMESERNSQADADKAENVTDVMKRHFRVKLGAIIRRQVLRPLVALNFGEDVARILTPTCMGGAVGMPDLAVAAAAFDAFRRSGGITDPMVPVVMRKWGGLEYIEGETQNEAESSGGKGDDEADAKDQENRRKNQPPGKKKGKKDAGEEDED